MSGGSYELKVSVQESELKTLIEAYADLDEVGGDSADFAAGILGQVLMRLEAHGKISGPSLYSPEFTIN